MDETADDPAAVIVDIDAEVFTVPRNKRALDYAVGRFPAAAPGPASIMMTLGFLRDERLRGLVPKVAMIANPAVNHSDLPLCETVSRLTSQELMNRKVELSEFYQTRTDDPRVVAAITRANLIIYQGHLGDQALLEDPLFMMNWPGGEERGDPDLTEEERRREEEADQAEQTDRGRDDFWAGLQAPPIGAVENDGQHRRRRFDGCPVLMLQSCQSLNIDTMARINRLGGAALIGSTTNIHSASGSSFAKAFIDGLVYDGQTIGEALRDARNYLFCLQDLKNARGHKEQHKSMRVALSFRLWGDPEIRPFPAPGRAPRRAPLSLAWQGDGKLRVAVPRKRLAEVRTKPYVARFFPRTQAAGIVRRGKVADGPRRIMPVYYLRLPADTDFLNQGYKRLNEVDGDPKRTIYRTNKAGTQVYILHFPAKEKADANLFFQFR